jgi:hypothetical protein
MEELGHYRTDPIGQWEADVVRLISNADRWIRGGHVPTALFEVRRVAHRVDQVPDELHLEALEKALGKLDRELEVFAAQVRGIAKEVGYLIAAVHQALELGDWPDEGPEYRDDLLDDSIVDRLGAFYGIPEPRQKR